jgi:hypothetical protein
MLGVALALRGRRNWLPVVAVLAALGQASLLNTYCHFHTPLSVSVLRTFNGLWIGGMCGVVAILMWRWLFDRSASGTGRRGSATPPYPRPAAGVRTAGMPAPQERAPGEP